MNRIDSAKIGLTMFAGGRRFKVLLSPGERNRSQTPARFATQSRGGESDPCQFPKVRGDAAVPSVRRRLEFLRWQ